MTFLQPQTSRVYNLLYFPSRGFSIFGEYISDGGEFEELLANMRPLFFFSGGQKLSETDI